MEWVGTLGLYDHYSLIPFISFCASRRLRYKETP